MRKPPKWLMAILFVWDLAWKAIAIRRAIQRKQYRWVPALLFANTIGVLPIVYLIRFASPEPPEDFADIL
jgi:hypothetical protein